jgi:hypothetical protein
MILRFLRRRSANDDGSTLGAIAAREDYRGFELLARPVREHGQWRLAGTVRRGNGDAAADYDFVRADTMADHDECVRMCLVKARQLVDEQGERLFADR